MLMRTPSHWVRAEAPVAAGPRRARGGGRRQRLNSRPLSQRRAERDVPTHRAQGRRMLSSGPQDDLARPLARSRPRSARAGARRRLRGAHEVHELLGDEARMAGRMPLSIGAGLPLASTITAFRGHPRFRPRRRMRRSAAGGGLGLLLELIEGASAPRTEQDHLAVQTDKSPGASKRDTAKLRADSSPRIGLEPSITSRAELAARRGGVEAERGVETCDCGEVGAAARHVQHDRSAEAVANGADASRVNRRMASELGSRGRQDP